MIPQGSLLFLLCFLLSCSAPLSRKASLSSSITHLRMQQKAEQKLLQGQGFSVEFDRNGIKLAGEYRLLRGGSFQWFRMPEATWEDRMKKYKELGFNALDIYIAWNQVEPREGEFNFEQPNLRHFLDLAKQQGLFVAIRPGPFITNEMDGGGLPAWLTRRSTKASFAADGLANLRSHDPDFIEPVRRYWQALHKVIAPYTADRGGPIVLYAIENEYTWFEKYLDIDKQFRLNGAAERPSDQPLPTAPYFQALRDIVRDTGIRIPIVTCPGDGKVSAMGDVAGVTPFPNVYEWANAGQPEEIIYDLLTDMHDPKKHGGIYQNVPTGSMEVNRSTQEIRRLLMGGADAWFAFNIIGMSQPGQMNALTLAARAGDKNPHWGIPDEPVPDWLGSIFDFSQWENIVNGFVSPKLGYFGGVVDYNGAVSSSGVLRDLYYQFRRDNFYYEAVEPWLARSERPKRSGTFPGADPDLTIHQNNIGARQQAGMFHYWHDSGDGTAFISLMNQSGNVQTIDLNAIQFRGETFPKYAPITVPLAQESRSFYDQILNVQLPLSKDFRLHYATSEVLSFRPWNKETLIVLYGPEQSLGEFKIDGQKLKLIQADPGFQVREAQDQSLLLTYPHQHGLTALVENQAGARLRIFISDSFRSGSIWFLQEQKQDVLVSGADFIDMTQDHKLLMDFDERPGEVLVMSPQELQIQGLNRLQTYDPITGIQRLARPGSSSWPKLPDLNHARLHGDRDELEMLFNTQDWITWQGNPVSLDSLGIYQGHAYYRSEFQVPDLRKLKDEELFINSASDIVGIYINGHYVTTLAPIGTEINNRSRSRDYQFASIKPFLQNGRNLIAFRTEIWGHGSFMFGRGNLPLGKARLPALGYDGFKGLLGESHIAGIPLLSWQVRAGLGGQDLGYANPEFDDSQWSPGIPSQVLGKGDITWMRTEFETDDLPDPARYDAPIVLHLEGFRSKGTIYLNGQLLGRWLSDAQWLEQGTWVRPQLGMWVSLDPNDLPIPQELLKKHGKNLLAIVFEDASSDKNPSGVINQVSLRYNREGSHWTQSGLKQLPGLRQKVDVTWKFKDGL